MSDLLKAAVILGVAIVVPAPAAAQFVCGGHFVTGVAARTAAADVDRNALLSQPSWFTARARKRWDELVYAAYDDVSAVTRPTALEDRRTLVLRDRSVPSITVCMEPSDATYTGERLAPYANEKWWREQFERWTGLRWRGDLQVNTYCQMRLFGVIVVEEGDPEVDDLGDNTLASTFSRITFGGWSSSRIKWHPDNLRKASDFQVEVALAHELGHALGLWHTEPGTGFIMDAHVPTRRPTWPAQERDLAQLAYEVGPGVLYPGLEGATPVPALPFLDRLFRWLIR